MPARKKVPHLLHRCGGCAAGHRVAWFLALVGGLVGLPSFPCSGDRRWKVYMRSRALHPAPLPLPTVNVGALMQRRLGDAQRLPTHGASTLNGRGSTGEARPH